MQEEDAANLVAKKMQDIGFDEVTIDPIYNVVGHIYGDGPEPELIFNGHIDHVPIADLISSCEVYAEIIRRACCS